MAVVKLRKDLINGPLHCFGYHTKCSTDFCKVKQNSHPSSSNMSSLPHGSTLSLPHCSSSSVSTPSLPISSSSFLSNPSLSHSNTPSLPHSSTPSLPHSSTPSLQYTNIQSLREMAFHSLPDANDDPGEVDSIMSQLQEDWYDCTNDKDLDEVRHIADKPLTTLDEAMICDIQ